MDKENNNDSSMIVILVLTLSAIIIGWSMLTRNEEYNNSQRSIKSIYSPYVHQLEKKVKE
jgi:hypothetical protein